jgi:hypothetical protein
MLNTIEEIELPEGTLVFSAQATFAAAAGVVTKLLFAAGRHPKCRLVRATLVGLVFSTTGDQYAIEDGEGNDATSAALQVTGVGTPVVFTLTDGQIFERNEAIYVKKTVEGNAANVATVHAQFENIH